MNTKNTHCLNCHNVVKGNYCSKCGQSVHTSRINIKHLVEELQYGFLHINKGILYTTKELIFRPGKTVKDYILGKRVKYTKPFVFLIIMGVVYSLVFHFFHYFPMQEMNRQDSPVFEYIPIYKWYLEHYSLVVLLIIPFYSLSTFWLFHKKEYNYAEHLVLFSYLTGAKIALLLCFYAIIYLTKSPHVYKIAQIVSEIYLIWGLTQFFKTTSWIKTLLKVLLSLVMALIIMLIIISIAFLILQIYNVKL